MKRIIEAEGLLIQCENDLKRLKKIHKELKKIESNRKKLNHYYEVHYLNDYDAHSAQEEHYKVLDQDSIWNVLNEQYNQKMTIVKKIIASL